jgi:hypothetical protein
MPPELDGVAPEERVLLLRHDGGARDLQRTGAATHDGTHAARHMVGLHQQ